MTEGKTKKELAAERKSTREQAKRKNQEDKQEKAAKRQKKKERKSKKDPNQPKRPPTAFFEFMSGFRVTFKETHPNTKGVAEVAKAGGDKWKSMTDEEKAPFVKIAVEKKASYQVTMTAYNKKKQEEEDDASDEKSNSKSEVNDGREEQEESGEDEEAEDEN